MKWQMPLPWTKGVIETISFVGSRSRRLPSLGHGLVPGSDSPSRN